MRRSTSPSRNWFKARFSSPVKAWFRLSNTGRATRARTEPVVAPGFDGYTPPTGSRLSPTGTLRRSRTRTTMPNRMTSATLPSGTGIVSTYSYDNADRLTGISHVKGGDSSPAGTA